MLVGVLVGVCVGVGVFVRVGVGETLGSVIFLPKVVLKVVIASLRHANSEVVKPSPTNAVPKPRLVYPPNPAAYNNSNAKPDLAIVVFCVIV